MDLGIKSLAVLSTREVVSNPRHFDGALRALRRAGRQASRRRGPDRRLRTAPSNRWRKTKARVAALHTRVANARRDGLHKLSTRLVGVPGHGHREGRRTSSHQAVICRVPGPHRVHSSSVPRHATTRWSR